MSSAPAVLANPLDEALYLIAKLRRLPETLLAPQPRGALHGPQRPPRRPRPPPPRRLNAVRAHLAVERRHSVACFSNLFPARSTTDHRLRHQRTDGTSAASRGGGKASTRSAGRGVLAPGELMAGGRRALTKRWPGENCHQSQLRRRMAALHVSATFGSASLTLERGPGGRQADRS